MMSRKDYEAVAEAINYNRGEAPTTPDRKAARNDAANDIARDLADVFFADNPRFDRDRFYEEAGVDFA